MRLKTLNLGDRSKTFSPATEKLIKNLTGDINKIGLMFDKFIELETFIMINILDEFEELVEVRSNRKLIEEEHKENYLDDYFKPAAFSLEQKLNETTEEWDLMNEDYSSLLVNRMCNNLKDFKRFINMMIDEKKLKSIETIGKIIDDFGRFQSISSMTSKNIVTRIEMLLKSKENILKINNNESYFDEINIEDFSIDDL